MRDDREPLVQTTRCARASSAVLQRRKSATCSLRDARGAATAPTAALLKSCYHPDAIEEHAGTTRATRSKMSTAPAPLIPGMGAMQHLLGTSHIEFDGDTAWVETYLWTFARFAADGRSTDTFTGGRLIDRFQHRRGANGRSPTVARCSIGTATCPSSEGWCTGLFDPVETGHAPRPQGPVRPVLRSLRRAWPGIGATPPPFRATYFPSSEMRVERRGDGTLIIEPVTELPVACAGAARSVGCTSCAASRPPLPRAARRPWAVPRFADLFAEVKAESDAVTQWLLDRRIPLGPLVADPFRKFHRACRRQVRRLCRRACPYARSAPTTR